MEQLLPFLFFLLFVFFTFCCIIIVIILRESKQISSTLSFYIVRGGVLIFF